MYYPAEVSKFKLKLLYIGKSTSRFIEGQTYEGAYVYGEERGWKAQSLDYLILSDGYKILPFEQRRFFEWVEGQTHKLLNIMYGRSYTLELMRNLVYSENPFLSLIKKDGEGGFSGSTYYPTPKNTDET